MKYLGIAITILGFISEKTTYAQGCSDAGFCSIGILNPLNADSLNNKKQTLSLLFTNGIGDENVYVFTPYLQYDNRLNEQWKVQAKIGANYASGNLGEAAGLSDILISATYHIPQRSKWSNSFTFGTKIFLSNSDITYQGNQLPMVYQSSLGTVDVIAGFNSSYKRWVISVGFQQPITAENSNAFLSESYNNDKASNYPPSRHLDRKADVLLRIGHNLIVTPKLKLNIGILNIYHVNKDTYRDNSISSNPIHINGSQGITVNVTSALRYKLNNKLSLGLTGGLPLVVRDIRPDGLTRSIVITPEINFRF